MNLYYRFDMLDFKKALLILFLSFLPILSTGANAFTFQIILSGQAQREYNNSDYLGFIEELQNMFLYQNNANSLVVQISDAEYDVPAQNVMSLTMNPEDLYIMRINGRQIDPHYFSAYAGNQLISV